MKFIYLDLEEDRPDVIGDFILEVLVNVVYVETKKQFC